MRFASGDFSRNVAARLVDHGTRLVTSGYLSAFNYLTSDRKLPVGRAILHSLQGTERQAAHVKDSIEELGLDVFQVPCSSFYELDERYVKSRTFKREYRDADFFTRKLKPVGIENVINSPKDKLVARKVSDLIIGLDDVDAVGSFMSYVLDADLTGPKPWRHPALIVVEVEQPIRDLPNSFHRKGFFNVRRTKSEFYSVIHDNTRERALEVYLGALFKQGQTLQKQLNISAEESIGRCHVNDQLNVYMKENIAPLRLVRP